MREDYTDITVILDRSGSMRKIKQATESGFNEFVSGQKGLPGKATLTLVKFDDEFRIHYLARDIREVPTLCLEPRGMTALYDAIGKAINITGNRLRKMAEAERPCKVVLVVITDGEENASKLFDRETVFGMIEHQKEKYSWEFIFLAANQDALGVGAGLGISEDYSMTFVANELGTHNVYNSLASNMTMLRSGEYVIGKGFFNAQDRDQQKQAGLK